MPISIEILASKKSKLAVTLAMGALALGPTATTQSAPEVPPDKLVAEQTPEWPLVGTVDGDKIVIPSEVMKHSTKTLPYILKRIGGCESNAGPNSKINYRAQNPYSTASGGFQFLDSTWDNFKGYLKAKYAPHTVQNEKAKIVLKKEGTRPWNATRSCWN